MSTNNRQNEYAPIVIFAFNRLQSLIRLVESLKFNPEYQCSDLYVFVDGARPEKHGEKDRVEQVKEYAKTIVGFKSTHLSFSDNNKGLARSIIAGVSEVIVKYGKIIVLEDDLEVMPNFLNFMNKGLDVYQDNLNVMSVCGFSCKVSAPNDYKEDSYFLSRSSSWGWATWKNRWKDVDWELKDWTSVEKNRHSFVKSQGSDVYSMLKGWRDGKNNSWAIRFCYAQHIAGRLSICPLKSLVTNRGFDGDGTNCRRYSRFKFELDNRKEHVEYLFPKDVRELSIFAKQAKKYHSIPLRLWSRLMYFIYK